MSRSLRTALSLSATLLVASLAHAQCPEWSEGFHLPGIDGPVYSMLSHDDGSGEVLYVAGWFDAVGDVAARNIAAWDGSEWRAVGDGIPELVLALTVYDDGSGEKLYAAGGWSEYFVASFDGSSWTTMPADGRVLALAVHDDGGGEALFASGWFDNIGGVAAETLARYDGAWSPLGQQVFGEVRALASYDDGNGARLYLGGDFYSPDAGTWGVASWGPSGFEALGSGILIGTYLDGVEAFQVFDDGQPDGPGLYVGGWFTDAGGVGSPNLARWSSSGWQALPDPGPVTDFAVRPDAGGSSTLFLATPFGAQRVGPSAVTQVGSNTRPTVIELFDDGTGERLVAGGSSAVPDNLVRWESGDWAPVLSGGQGIVFPAAIQAVGAYELDGTPELLVGGGDFTAGGEAIHYVGRFDGTRWHSVGDNLSGDRVGVLITHGNGSSRALYAAGEDLRVDGVLCLAARFDGNTWERLGLQTYSRVHSAIVFRESGQDQLFLGGQFSYPQGSSPYLEAIARWDGTSWRRVGGGVDYGTWGPEITDLALYDDGRGEALYAAGRFDSAGGVPVANIARWDGVQWEDVGGGLVDLDQANLEAVQTLEVFDGPDGELLVAGGRFHTAGGAPIPSIAAWDGTSWSSLGGGIGGANPFVDELESFDPDGNGERLYAYGRFESAGGFPAQNAAVWDGASWTPLDITGSPNDLASFDNGEGRSLYLVGTVAVVEGRPSSGIARLTDTCGAIVGNPTCTALQNSAGLRGRMRAAGSASAAAEDLTLSARNLPAGAATLFFHGVGDRRFPFGEGLRCIGRDLRRIFPVGAATGGTYDLTLDFGARYATDYTPGRSLLFQAWYRDGMGGPAGSNTTDALRILFQP